MPKLHTPKVPYSAAFRQQLVELVQAARTMPHCCNSATATAMAVHLLRRAHGDREAKDMAIHACATATATATQA